MPKASPLLRGFNGGVFSKLMEGRTDLDRYPMSMRQMTNFYPTAQGPALRRSGTMLQVPIYDEAARSAAIPFAFSNDVGQVFNIELANLRARFISEAGLLAYTPVAITAELASAFVKVTAAGHATVAGDQVVLAGFAFNKNLNGRVGNVTAVAGNDVTTDILLPAGGLGSLATATLAKVYSIVMPYATADVPNVRYVGDRDAIYLFCGTYAARKLVRYGAYDWRLSEVDWQDGPYDVINETVTRLTPASTGNAIPIMTSNVLPATYVAAGSSVAGGSDYFHAFDDNPATYWESNVNQSGILQFTFPANVIVDGYAIELARVNNDASYKSVDYAPSTWTFEGYDGANWIILHSVVEYVAYDNLRSLFFRLKNATGYISYRINITQCVRNGPISPRIARLVMTSRASAAVVVTASAITGINNDTGFQATDIGRLLRLEGKDGVWRWLKMTARASTTVATFEIKADVLASLDGTTEWRLGLFSATTGYPTCGGFFEDRLFVGGMSGYPDWLVGSVPGKYETILQTDTNGSVSDDNGIVLRLNARRLGRVAWIASDNKALLIGTGAGEWEVKSSDLQQALTARTAKARRATVRGSATIEPVLVDRQLLFVQRGGRQVREMSYAFDIDGYKTPSMSLFSSHLLISGIEQIDFAYEPLSTMWARCTDGSLIGLTYNREENVIGWHSHDLAGGFVENLTVLPGADGKNDTVWLIVRRTIGGVTRRFHERLMSPWNFDSTLATAHFVDAGVRYQGAAINEVYGLHYFEGATLYGLVDGSPITPVVVASGKITIPESVTGTNIILGLGYDSLAETSRLEAGAGDGTAQGKVKRITRASVRLWDTGGGKIGTRDADDNLNEDLLQEIAWLTPNTQLDTAPPLRSGDTKPINLEGGYNESGTIVFKQGKELPLPFNVVAIMPQLNTQDR